MGRPRKSKAHTSAVNRANARKRHHGPPRKPQPKPSLPAGSSDPLAAFILQNAAIAAGKKPLPTNRPATLADYDQLIGQPEHWTDAKTREQVQKEILDNEAKQDENAIRRGKLYTKDQVLEQLREFREMVFQHFAKLPELTSELVDAEKKEDARRRAREFVTDMRKTIAREIGERKGK